MFWDIISMSVGSLLWGVLISLSCMALFVFIITGWWKDALFTVWSYLIGAVLFLMLAVQCTLIVGSLKVIDTVDEYEALFTEIVDNLYDGCEEVSALASDDVVKEAIDRFPLLGHYIGGGNFEGYNARELPTVMAEELRSYMRGYIVRRLLWCLGFVVVAGILGILSLSKRTGTVRFNHGRNHSPRNSREAYPRTSNIGHRHHISTRRR